MKKVAVIDADFIGRPRHRFPNLTCMKISGYHKQNGDDVTLKLDYCGLDAFDKVYIAKVFTDTPIPYDTLWGNPLTKSNVEYGGTGFFTTRRNRFRRKLSTPCPIITCTIISSRQILKIKQNLSTTLIIQSDI